MADKHPRTDRFPTRNNLSDNAKAVSIAILNARVADSIDYALAVKQAHWNIKGHNFIGVHKLLDEVRAEVDEFVDLMAERAVSLGGTALGTTQVVARDSALPPYPTNIHRIDDHLRALIERHGDVANKVRSAIEETDKAGDSGTSDLFTEVSRGLDERLWMLEAHLQD